MKSLLSGYYLFFLILFPLFSKSQDYQRVQLHPKSWKFNSGLDVGAWWGGTGVNPLKSENNSLIRSDLGHQTAYTGDIYLEWLHRKNEAGKVGPDIGIKTKLVWDYFTANNGGSGASYESLTLNYVNIPLLFEYCLSFKNKVTREGYTPGSSNSQTAVYDHGYYYHVITTTTTTPGSYHPGGIPYNDAIFVYAGPQFCYLTRGYHNVDGASAIDNDPALQKAYIGFVGGFCFYLANLNIDISYQHGLSSIAKGGNVDVSGFFFKLGFNLTRRNF